MEQLNALVKHQSAADRNELLAIEERIINVNFRYSGIQQRDFFESLYYREPNSLLIEVATEQTYFEELTGPTDDYDDIPLILPPFLEDKRAAIERSIQK